jgi:hypothetical protein
MLNLFYEGVSSWWAARRTRRALELLPERTLRDIGMLEDSPTVSRAQGPGFALAPYLLDQLRDPQRTTSPVPSVTRPERNQGVQAPNLASLSA